MINIAFLESESHRTVKMFYMYRCLVNRLHKANSAVLVCCLVRQVLQVSAAAATRNSPCRNRARGEGRKCSRNYSFVQDRSGRLDCRRLAGLQPASPPITYTRHHRPRCFLTFSVCLSVWYSCSVGLLCTRWF